MWNAIAGGTLIGAPAPTPIHSLPRDLEQEELYEFGRWTRAAIPIGAGHRTFHITSYYGPPKGDLIRNGYADRLLKMLFQCSQDFGAQMPAAICCDLNRNPDECAYLKVAMAKLGWADLGQIAHGEGTAPPTYYHYGAAHEGMEGHGCSRIDLILVNTIALAAFQSYAQIYGCGIAKHSFISATFHLPAFGAMVTMPKTPASVMSLDRYELPEAVNEELVQFAMSPNERTYSTVT